MNSASLTTPAAAVLEKRAMALLSDPNTPQNLRRQWKRLIEENVRVGEVITQKFDRILSAACHLLDLEDTESHRRLPIVHFVATVLGEDEPSSKLEMRAVGLLSDLDILYNMRKHWKSLAQENSRQDETATQKYDRALNAASRLLDIEDTETHRLLPAVRLVATALDEDAPSSKADLRQQNKYVWFALRRAIVFTALVVVLVLIGRPWFPWWYYSIAASPLLLTIKWLFLARSIQKQSPKWAVEYLEGYPWRTAVWGG